MSLLSSLLAFSALNEDSTRQNRSASVGSRFLFEQQTPKANRERMDQKQTKRVQSKSLTKLSFFSNESQPKIDPKHRCLHRIAHNLSMKVRKHYFAFFVVLETMKKKNTSLIQLLKSKKYDQNTVISASNRLNQTLDIIILKQYEKQWKLSCFKAIKKHSRDKNAVNRIQKLLNNGIILKYYFQRFLAYSRYAESLEIKLDIFINTVETIFNSQSTHNNNNLQQGFAAILQHANQNNTNTVNLYSPERKKQKELTYKVQVSPSSMLEQSVQQSILNQSFNNSGQKSSQKSPIKACKKMFNLRQAIFQDTIDREYKDVSKLLQINTNLNQQPIQFDFKNENLPKMMKKQLPQQLGLDQIGDLEDNSNIFREFKTNRVRQKTEKGDKVSVVSNIEHLDISDAVGESFLRIQNMISDMERYRDKEKINNHDYISNLSISGVGGIPIISQDCSMIDFKDKLNDSSFGTDAVTFKNSLVMERQSMQKLDRERVSFLKKKSSAGKKNKYSAEHITTQKQAHSNLKRSIKKQLWPPLKNDNDDLKDKPKRKNQYIQEDYLIEPTNNFADQYCTDRNCPDFLGKINSKDNFFSQNDSLRHNDKMNKPMHTSQEKPKSFSFQYKSGGINPKKLKLNDSNGNSYQDYDQRSDEGIKYQSFGMKIRNSQPIFQNHWNSSSKVIFDRFSSNANYPQEYLPERDVNVNNKEKNMKSSSFQQNKQERERTNSFNTKRPTMQMQQSNGGGSANKNASYSESYRQTNNATGQKQAFYPPKKFINLIRK